MITLCLVLIFSTPPATSGHSLVYFGKTKSVLLLHGDANEKNGVWSWDGKRWGLVAESKLPTRSLSAAAYSPEQEMVIVHGGAVGTPKGGGQMDWNVSAETLGFDGKEWKTLATAGPAPRDHHAMVYDSDRKRLVLFGGTDAQPSGLSVYYGDTWEWDGKAWSKAATVGPGGRCHFAMAYDPVHKETVMVGGYGPDGPDGKTWVWNGKSWRAAATGGAGYRTSPRMAFDRKLGMVVLFGGEMQGESPSNTLAWDGKDWKEIAKEGPPGRSVHAMAYDEARGVIVLFGGYDRDSRADTWEFAEGKWKEIR